MTATIIAHASRSGIVALNVVTGALDTDARTRELPLVFAKTRGEVAAAIEATTGPVIVAHSFYSTDARRAADELAWLRANAPTALHIAGGVHATAEPAGTLAMGFDIVVAGEGEAPFVELVAAVAEGRDARGGIGTQFLVDGVVERGPAAPRRPLDDFPAANLRHGRWNLPRSRSSSATPITTRS